MAEFNLLVENYKKRDGGVNCLGHAGRTLSVDTKVDLIKISYPPVWQGKKQMLDRYLEMYTK